MDDLPKPFKSTNGKAIVSTTPLTGGLGGLRYGGSGPELEDFRNDPVKEMKMKAGYFHLPAQLLTFFFSPCIMVAKYIYNQ